MSKVGQLADEVVAVIKGHVKRSFEQLREYIDDKIIDAIASARSHATKSDDALLQQFDARIDAIRKEQSAAQPETEIKPETIRSLEQRASRHADHLARLESRLQQLEHKGR